MTHTVPAECGTGPVIEADELCKSYGSVLALDGVTFSAPAGVITGFVGANGAGKTTVLKILLGLCTPDHGKATVNGVVYRDLSKPARTVGAALGSGLHPNRSARNHLRVLAAAIGVGDDRVDECLTRAGLGPTQERRGKELSTGMRARLRVAGALLGDPGALVLDEPSAGMDVDGQRWLHGELRRVVRAGGTVLVSSHDLAALSLLVDRAVFINAGKVLDECCLEDLGDNTIALQVRTTEPKRLTAALRTEGAEVEAGPRGTLRVEGLTSDQVGTLAQREGLVISELAPSSPLLEQATRDLERGRTEQ